MTDIFKKPTGKGLRSPQDNNRINGRIVNVPRYSELGGLSGPSSIRRNGEVGKDLKIKKPGV